MFQSGSPLFVLLALFLSNAVGQPLNEPDSGPSRFLMGAEQAFHFPPRDRGPATLVRAGDEEPFLALMKKPGPAKTFIVLPGVSLQQLDIIGRHGDQLIFQEGANVEGSTRTRHPWSDDRGVVNIVDSTDIYIQGLKATNLFQYDVAPQIGLQESTALNVSRSQRIRLDDCDLTGNGKGVCWVHSDSQVRFLRAKIKGYYFCVGVGASEVAFKSLRIEQFNPKATGDKHAVIWVSSSVRAETNNQYFEVNRLYFHDTMVQLGSGRAIVAGNGAYAARSYVLFDGVTRLESVNHARQTAKGWSHFHQNYHGYSIFLRGNYPATTSKFVTANHRSEFADFYVHQYGDSGRPTARSPVVVAKWKSDAWEFVSSAELTVGQIE